MVHQGYKITYGTFAGPGAAPGPRPWSSLPPEAYAHLNSKQNFKQRMTDRAVPGRQQLVLRMVTK